MTAKAALLELKQALGEGAAELPPLKHLDEAQIKALIEAVQAARQQQRKTLNKAMEDALGHVPMLLRGAVRKLFFG